MKLPTSSQSLAGPLDNLIGRIYSYFSTQESSVWARILLIAALAVVVHILVKCIVEINRQADG
jgi:hypothetical protein